MYFKFQLFNAKWHSFRFSRVTFFFFLLLCVYLYIFLFFSLSLSTPLSDTIWCCLFKLFLIITRVTVQSVCVCVCVWMNYFELKKKNVCRNNKYCIQLWHTPREMYHIHLYTFFFTNMYISFFLLCALFFIAIFCSAYHKARAHTHTHWVWMGSENQNMFFQQQQRKCSPISFILIHTQTHTLDTGY